ncbi:dehydrogenase/reductase SDR family member 4-like [Diaphorina citri]|uniref:Dehydrogenase/reductase SDR family member 4-like n=1 Tax=Diaphorina citri TaxID=121845 RepID=A0A3Q0JLU0_DIACI|nr:dehydrogenase/reductase SDR family member 4-like [Diaphorina citri]
MFKATRLVGKVAVITASTEGIGFAIAKRLSAEGASVVISSRKESNVNKAVETLQKEGHQNVSGVVCHVANTDERQKLFEHVRNVFRGIDILVSNAAVNPANEPLVECSEVVWDKIFDVNLKSSFLLTQEVLPYMRKKKGGSIVYVSSIGGFKQFKVSILILRPATPYQVNLTGTAEKVHPLGLPDREWLPQVLVLIYNLRNLP